MDARPQLSGTAAFGPPVRRIKIDSPLALPAERAFVLAAVQAALLLIHRFFALASATNQSTFLPKANENGCVGRLLGEIIAVAALAKFVQNNVQTSGNLSTGKLAELSFFRLVVPSSSLQLLTCPLFAKVFKFVFS